MRLATCEVLEHVSRTKLNRLKVQHFKRAIEVADSSVGQWSDTIRHSGRPLHSPNTFSRQNRRRNRARTGKAISIFVEINVQTTKGSGRTTINEDGDEEFFVNLQ